MATTVNEATSHSDGGLTFLHLKLTVGAADITAAYTIAGKPELLMMTQPFKTTGTTGDMFAIYNKSTGTITVSSCANNDVIRYTVAY